MADTIRIPNTLTLEACEFVVPPQKAGDASKAPCKMTARSGRAINMPYVGAVVHDFSGMRQLAARLNVDYCHDPSQLIGYCEKLSADSGDLQCEAQIFSVRDGDRAAEVLARAAEGQPYQCSIKWDDGQIERLAQGQSAMVNGRLVNGPALVVRQWTLRGIAVCPYGADVNTAAEFSADQIHNLTIDTEATMADESKSPTPEEIRTQLQAQAQDYVTRFGELGAQWFAAGKPLVECYGEFTKQIGERHTLELQAAAEKYAGELATRETQIADLTKQVGELQARVTSLGQGGGAENPVSGGAAKEGAAGGATHQAGEYSSVLPPALARLAAGIKMPAAA